MYMYILLYIYIGERGVAGDYGVLAMYWRSRYVYTCILHTVECVCPVIYILYKKMDVMGMGMVL